MRKRVGRDREHLTISLEGEHLTNLDQLATGALVQLGVLRTGALDQYDDDGDGDGDDDDEEVGLSSEAWRVSNEAEPK